MQDFLKNLMVILYFGAVHLLRKRTICFLQSYRHSVSLKKVHRTEI